MKTGRNDPCPCGSGAKFKKCCERKASSGERTSSWSMTLLVGAVVLGVVALGISLWQGDDATPDRVWSPEHGHWHTVGDEEQPAAPAPASRPPGPAPPGKVWSEEHGHWHDVR